MSVAIAVMSVIVFAKQLIPFFPSSDLLVSFSHIAWPWYVLIGTSITMIVGILSSFTHGERAYNPND
jgi:hypothetical protein